MFACAIQIFFKVHLELSWNLFLTQMSVKLRKKKTSHPRERNISSENCKWCQPPYKRTLKRCFDDSFEYWIAVLYREQEGFYFFERRREKTWWQKTWYRLNFRSPLTVLLNKKVGKKKTHKIVLLNSRVSQLFHLNLQLILIWRGGECQIKQDKITTKVQQVLNF